MEVRMSIIRKGGRRRVVALAAVCVAGLLGSLLLAQPASADADGCTPASSGMVCGVVDGNGLYVDSAGVVRDKADLTGICNYQGVLTVYNSAGSQIFQQKSGKRSGCTHGRAWFDFYPRRYFPNKSKITLSFYEANVLQGAVSFRITT